MNPKTDGRVGGTITATRVRADRTKKDISKTSGLSAGTVVMTLKGEVAVENLQLGDRIITRDSGTATLTGLSSKLTKTKLVTIKANTLGNARPDRDMRIAPDTQILIRDWRAEALFGSAQAKVSALRLLDGEFVSQDTEETEVALFSLEFASEHVVYADGIEVFTS